MVPVVSCAAAVAAMPPTTAAIVSARIAHPILLRIILCSPLIDYLRRRAYHYDDFPPVPTLKRGAPVPLYHQLKTALLRDIESGRGRPGDRIPTEDALIDRYQVSKITVRQALRDLAQMGYIRREQGRGTFVQGPPLEEGPRELKSFTSEMRSHGFSATSRVLEQ